MHVQSGCFSYKTYCLFDVFDVVRVLGPVYMEWGPRSSGVGFFCFHALGDTKQKKLTPLDRGPPLHVNRVLKSLLLKLPIVEIQKFCYHGNLTSHFSSLLMDKNRVF